MNSTLKACLVLGGGLAVAVGLNSYLQKSVRHENPTIAPTPETSVASSSANQGVKVMDVDQLKVEDIKVGTGAAVKSGDHVVMNYSGTLLDGTKFDSSYDRGVPFETQIGVGQVIEGWDKGIIGMKVGGKRRLTIPSSMGYGTRGAGNVIPPNAGLLFDVELIQIKK